MADTSLHTPIAVSYSRDGGAVEYVQLLRRERCHRFEFAYGILMSHLRPNHRGAQGTESEDVGIQGIMWFKSESGGEMGLFNSRKGKRKKQDVGCFNEFDELQEMRRHSAEKDRLCNEAIDKLREAADYKKNGMDIHSAIAVFEKHIIDNPTGSNWSFRYYEKLVSMYIETGQNDKAWGFLNWSTIEKPGERVNISKQQFRILKSEGRYIDAFDHLICQYYYSGLDQRLRGYAPEFNRERFIKDAMPILRKLSMSENEVSYITQLIEDEICNPSDEASFRKRYRSILQKYSA